MMHDLQISFYGRSLPLDREEAVDGLIAYLQTHKRLLALSRCTPETSADVEERTPLARTPQSATIAEAVDERPNVRDNVTDEGESEIRDEVRDTSEPVHLIDWFERAWAALGEPESGVTGNELYDALIEIGFRPVADHPRDAIKTAIRVNPRFRKVGVAANKAALWKLKPRTAQSSSLTPPNASRVPTNGYKGPAQNHNPPKGERVIDFAIKAWQAIGKGVSIAELADKMVEMDWVTTGDPTTTLSSTLRKPRYKNTFQQRDGLWFYIGEDGGDRSSLADPLQASILDDM